MRRLTHLWRPLSGATLVACALLAFVAPRVMHASPYGDADVARALFDSGRDAFKEKRYHDALRFFERALTETSEVYEAAYWQGQTYDKLKQTSEALAAYESFLLLHKNAAADGEVDRALVTLAGKAEKRVEKLAAGRDALEELNSAFAEQLVAFALLHKDSDVATAREAIDHALRVDPGHAEALELRGDLGGDDGDEGGSIPPAPPGPFAPLDKGPWHDFIGRKTLGTDTARYPEGLMTLDLKGGKAVMPTERVRTGPKWVLEADFRVVEAHKRNWLVGFAFAWEGDEYWSAFSQVGQVVLNRGARSKGPQEDVEIFPMKPIKPDRWHRLAMKVDDGRVVIWFDGEVAITYSVDDAARFNGDIGIFQQGCKTEYRLLRSAVLE